MHAHFVISWTYVKEGIRMYEIPVRLEHGLRYVMQEREVKES